MSTNNELNLLLGTKVKALRKERKITREKLAEAVDVSTRFLADVESGKAGVSLSTLKKLCVALSVTADHLLGMNETTECYMALECKLRQVPAEHLDSLEQIIDAFIKATGRRKTITPKGESDIMSEYLHEGE